MDEPGPNLDEKEAGPLLLIPSSGGRDDHGGKESSKLAEIQETAARRKAKILEKKLQAEKIKSTKALSRAIPTTSDRGHVVTRAVQTTLVMDDLNLFTVYHREGLKSIKIPTYYQTALSLMIKLKELFEHEECFQPDERDSLKELSAMVSERLETLGYDEVE